MATFTNKGFIKHDDYMTPKSAWDDIKQVNMGSILWKWR